ncbi:single-stranded DNA-binding protein [Candidatus Fermentibacteria bacterium]|nr:single-stranded DNA-binding protein [Candidatus Fermentibacteria bacterium]
MSTEADSPLLAIADDLTVGLRYLHFSHPVACIYNPLEYAREGYRAYVIRFGAPPKETLILGMNPGPWGMAQTGVPFGEVHHVREWLGIDEIVGRPANELPSRPVHGFSCPRSEVSGARVWGWARDAFETPERFFAHHFVGNYCPLIFFDKTGRNLTPDRLKAAEKERLFAACDAALRRTILHLRACRVVALGRFAFSRALDAASGMGLDVLSVPHPSPANPAANRGWATLMSAAFSAGRRPPPVAP